MELSLADVVAYIVAAVRTFTKLETKEITALCEKTMMPARDVRFEPFKTTHDYDGTIHNPQWLG